MEAAAYPPTLSKSASDSALRVPQVDGTGDGGSGGGDDDDDDAGIPPPNLNREVAALSNKLIASINHQTQLDDSLSSTRHELEMSKIKIKHLESMAQKHADMMANGLLVEKKDVESETQQLMSRLTEERVQRGKAEKDKRNIEQELESLTTALFDEANKMVSAARKERDAMDRKNEQLRAQLADTELLLASHQEQLAELKMVMQQMTAEREESEMTMSTGTAPSTPALGNRSSKESLGRMFEALHLSPNTAGPEEIPPCHPTSLTSLVHPVLRHDIAAYSDFCEVLHAPKPGQKMSPMTRLSSGSFSSIQVMGMGISYNSTPNHSPTASASGLFTVKNAESANPSPSSASASGPTNNQTGQGLKETKFYKRVLVEDVEPTLRLDSAPGLSWLARRAVLSSITDGSLVIDPTPSSTKLNSFSCSLCGESKADETHARTHRMRTSENANAQRYPLCGYCVTRTRAVCDFMAFLRTLKEGMWKCETPGDERHAWEESVKLRERMFWARIGGGVIPAFLHHRDSARSSSEEHLEGVVEESAVQTPPRTPVPVPVGDGESKKLEVPKKRASRERSDLYRMPGKKLPLRDGSLPSPPDTDKSEDGEEDRKEIDTLKTEAEEEEAELSNSNPVDIEDTVDEKEIDSSSLRAPPSPSPSSSTTIRKPLKSGTSTPRPAPSELELESESEPHRTIPGGW